MSTRYSKLLQPVLDSLLLFLDNENNMSLDAVRSGADQFYHNVVDSLHECAELFVPKRKTNFYKFWWCQELDILKENSISSCIAWRSADKPEQGSLFLQYKRDKLI